MRDQKPLIKILSVSSNRADVGIVSNVWNLLAQSRLFDLHILLTGTHICDDSYVRQYIPSNAKVYQGGADITGSVGVDLARHLSKIGEKCTEFYSKVSPNLILVVGDRLEMLPAVTSSLPLNIPIGHIAGGDISEGAIDDRVRHAITKLSHVHFVLNKHSARRVSQMGEQLWRINIVGAPNLDALRLAKALPPDLVKNKLGLKSLEKLRLVTIHPETNSLTYDEPLAPILEALDRCANPTIITAPNADPGGIEIAQRLKQFAAKRCWAQYRENLGSELYSNVMRYSSTMVGNSSSGIIEAGLYGLSVINVGNRQSGRDAGHNVFHCASNADEVFKLLSRLEKPATKIASDSLYGDGNAANRIVNVLAELPSLEELLFKRFSKFQNTKFVEPWSQQS